MYQVRKYLIYILSCCFFLSSQTLAQAIENKAIYQYGLTFNSYEVEKDERTTLNLTPEKTFSFPNGFTLEFDVSFKQMVHNFGYVFRIVTEGNENVDFLLSNIRTDADKPQFTTIYKSGQILCNQTFQELNTNFDQWIKVKLIVNPKKQLFKLKVNDCEFEKTEEYFGKLKNIHIVFGKSNLLYYENSDVPKMTIRNISIKDLNEKPIYFWRLGKHVQNGVYDEIRNRFASCKEGKWMLDSHTHWQVDTVFKTRIYPQITFNRKENQVVVVDKKTFYKYDIVSHILEKNANTDGIPLANKSNNLGYNSLSDAYFTYNFIDETALYNDSAKTWSNKLIETKDPYYWHHNQFFSPINNTLYTWGGYGFHIYKNDINKYHFETKTWERGEYKGDTIAPRYLAGLGALDDKTVLLFGGYGSERGDQELSPRNYYDLYSYNLETSETKKIWELDAKEHSFVVANSLVVDTLNRCFYALCFPHQKYNSALQLYRFSIEKPTYEILADSIPYLFSDVFSYADLYLSSDSERLIAVTSYSDDRNMQATVKVYSQAFPPLNKMDLIQEEVEASNPLIYILIFSAIISLLLVLLWRYKKKTQSSEDTTEPDKPSEGITKEEETYDPIVGIKPLYEKQQKRSILLFGGFQVIDNESNNITGEFTPTLKQLFLLILLYTLKDGKGISSVKLREILWYDKSNESAKNNRGVSLSKLRVIFEKIGGISISGVNSYWKVEFDKDIYCDYYEALILMNRLTKETDHKDLNRLIAIVSTGELLPNVETEWVDSFKADFSNRLIDLLLNFAAHSSEYKLVPSTMINMADAIFAHDSLNEDALRIKCTTLVEMGKNGLAQKVYASFTKEYQSLFGVEFKYTFEQIIS